METAVRRHGDLLLVNKTGFKIPKEVKLKKASVLHKGTNHDHYFSKGDVRIGEHEGKKYFRVVKDAVISHGRGKSSEHKPKPVPKGDYWLEIQTEFDHVKQIKRAVID